MLRTATATDLPRLAAIRDASGRDALSDPALLGDAELQRLIAAGTVTVWNEDGSLAGFAAVDGATIHLLVDVAIRGKGVGRALLAAACSAVARAGCAEATLSLAPGAAAERHYRAAGWIVAGATASGGMVLNKRL